MGTRHTVDFHAECATIIGGVLEGLSSLIQFGVSTEWASHVTLSSA